MNLLTSKNKKPILVFIIFCTMTINSCTHNFYLKTSELSVDQEILKDLNEKGNSLSSLIYLKNGEVFKTKNFIANDDSLSFQGFTFDPIKDEPDILNLNTEYQQIPINEVDKIQFTSVMKGGINGLFVGFGLGLASGFLLGNYQPLDGEDPPPRELVIVLDSIFGGVAGAIIGLPIGLIVKKREVYHIESQKNK